MLDLFGVAERLEVEVASTSTLPPVDVTVEASMPALVVASCVFVAAGRLTRPVENV